MTYLRFLPVLTRRNGCEGSIQLLISLRHRVVAMRAPRMAATDPFCAEPDAFENSPLLNGFDGVLRTRGQVPATGPEVGRKRQLVEPDGENEELFEEIVHSQLTVDNKQLTIVPVE